MEKRIKFRKAQGRKEKRHVSSFELEFVMTHSFYLCAGDEIVLNTSKPTHESNFFELRLILDESIYLEVNDKIKVKCELSPSIVSAVVEK